MGAAIQSLQAGLLNQSSAQVIDGSLKFDASKTTYLSRTPSSAGNQRTWTWSGWIKRDSKFGSSNTLWSCAGNNSVRFGNINDIEYIFDGNYGLRTSQVFRDTGWYHILFSLDTTQATAADRVKLYINGEQVTSFASTGYGNQNDLEDYNTTVLHTIGIKHDLSTATDFDGRMSQVYFIDGQQLGPGYFGFTDPLTNTWRPKKYTGDFNIGSSNLTVYPAPYSAAARFSSSADFGTVTNNDTGYTLPMSNPSHYGGKVIELDTGGFKVTTVNSATTDFFMGMWVKFETYADSRQFGINLNENYVYFETRSGGAVKIRHTGDGGNTGSATNLDDGGWHHVALSRTGNTLYGFVDGTAVSSDSGGTSGVNSVLTNCDWWFWGGSGTSYNIDGQVIDPFIYIGQGVSSYTTPTAPLIDASGNINHFSGFSDTQAYYISPGVDVSGSSPNPVPNYFVTGTNSFYLPMDGNSPIGEDKSGNGNSWTPVNFGGSVEIDKATGALPILNTDGGGRTARVGVRTDANAANLVLALPLVGSANDVSNQINSGSTTKAVTTNGDPTASTTQSNFYGGSFDFDGSGDYFNTSTSSSDFSFGTGDFTIEAWCFVDSGANNKGLWQLSTTSGGLQSANTTLSSNYEDDEFYFGSAGGWRQAGRTHIDNTWHHVAEVRSSGTIFIYVDGVLDQSWSDTTTYDMTYWAVGGYYSTSYLWSGYIQDFRVYKGVAKYTSNFIPASTNPDILPDTPSGVSGGSKLAKVTDGAVAFDGTGDYLSGPSSDTFVSDAQYTIDGFIYLNSAPGNNAGEAIFDTGSGGSDPELNVYNNSGNIQLYDSLSNNTNWNGGASYMGVKKWHYFKQTVNGSSATDASATHKLYIDGKLGVSNTINLSSRSASSVFAIGARTNGSVEIDAFISNLRYRSVLDDSLTVPTAPLTNVTNTKLLCCQSNSEGPQKTAVIPSATGTAYAMWPVNSDINDDSGNNRTLTENGGSTSFLSADANKFGITNAANFVKDSKYLSYAVTPASAWTIDGYIRLETATTSAPYILGWNGTNGNDTTFGFPSDGSLKFSVFGSFGVLDSGVVAEVGRWYHIRMTTNSTSDCKLFVDGVLVAQQTSSDGGPVSPITFGDVQGGRFSGQIAGVRYTPTDLGAPPLGGETTSNGVTTNSPPVGIKLNGNVSADNFNPFNTDINTVRGQETGYCTLNPLDKSPQTNIVLTNGNLDAANTSSSGQGRVDGTIAFSSGKWYFEGTVTGSSNYHEIGIIKTDQLLAYGIGFYSGGYSYNQGGNKFNSNATVAYGGSYTTGDTIGVAFNLDKGTLVFYKNGVSRGTAYTGLSGEFTFTVGTYSSGANFGWSSNFGQKPFKYAPPEGFQPLNAANVTPETVITRPTNFVDVRSGQQAQFKITDLDFKTDLMIAKSTSNSEYWIWADSVRGFNGGLKSDTTNADGSGLAIANVNGNGYESDSNWFTGSRTYTTYNFKAGGNKNTFNIDDVGYASAAAANMSVGSLNSASYNQTQTWSNNVTTTGNSGTFSAKTAMFDADLTNSTHCNGDGSAAVSVRLTLSPAVQCNSSVSLFGGITSGTSGTITINGTTTFNLTPCATVDPAFSDVTTVPFSGPITSITITKTTVNAAGMILYGWRIDDKLLIDNGVTPTNSPSLAATGASVGTKQGFSIIKYAGSNNSSAKTIPHGLSQKPDFMIIKQLTDSSTAWTIYHSASNVKPNLKYLEFDDGDITDATGPWGDFDPTSSVFTVGSGYNNVNRVSRNFISFHWHNVPGLQKFGSYTGNNDSDAADGPFVELGFRPSLLWIKRLGTGNWIVYDNKRDTINPLDGRLKLNTDGANVDNSGYNLDFLSNGFKIIGGNNDNYNAASTYIYCAWAEAPEFNLYGGQSNAR